MKIISPAGLSFEFHENGNIKSIQAGPIRISLKPASAFSASGANIYLRKRGHPIEFMPLTGPGSGSRFHFSEKGYLAIGTWAGIDYHCALHLSDEGTRWQWVIDISNTTNETVELDLIHMQEIGLKPASTGPVNEYYVSQYLERRILHDPVHGAVICCRQNMKEATGHPWLMIASRNGAASASTDGMQFYGKTYRETGIPEGLLADTLGGECAGESPVVALQEKPFRLAPGATHNAIFMALYIPDHPEATTNGDLQRLDRMEAITGTPSQLNEMSSQPEPNPSLSFLPTEDLTQAELSLYFGPRRHHEEKHNGQLLSFFDDKSNHVVLRAKEILADRPHGHIMQAGKRGFVPAESILSTTAFMYGVFNSHITQGNTNFNTLLSVCTSQFNQSHETGQRIHVKIKGRQYLLGVPPAFEMGLNHCRWIYKIKEHVFQVRTWTSQVTSQVNLDFRVLRGHPVELLITHDFDPSNGWNIQAAGREATAIPAPDSIIASRFPGARFRMVIQNATGMESLYNGTESRFDIQVSNASSFCMSIVGEVTGPAEMIKIDDPERQWLADCRAAQTEWKDLSLDLRINSENDDIDAIREILPWYGADALIHYLTPYGLEQFGGAAWGTRDVSQGPVELLISLQKYDEARQVLCMIFSNQNPDGWWPQWWMFDSYHTIRAHEAHGDIAYWTIIALASYIKATGDTGILDEVLSYYNPEGQEKAEKTPLSEHVDRLITLITASFIPGTALVPFGGGDWNDSLQPVSPDLARRLISSWTVEMNYQAFSEYATVFQRTGKMKEARDLMTLCEKIKDDFNRHLVKEGIVAGYGLLEGDGRISVLLHPSDRRTGIKYSLLPMERGIFSGIFTREQAFFHLGLIEKHLKGPDGARLMDRPLKYKGGLQEIFQRAESSTFFGREIGLMYVHEHIRYAEALAGTGDAEAFVRALRQAIPVGYRDIVPCGDIRQANCYYSSSDVHFRNRFEADERYGDVIEGKYTLRGGWRVYSSGPGIFISIIVNRLFGLRIENDTAIIDPVMPKSFNGLKVDLEFFDHPVTFVYRVSEGEYSPKHITVNGQSVQFSREENKYRDGGASIPLDELIARLNGEGNIVEVTL